MRVRKTRRKSCQRPQPFDSSIVANQQRLRTIIAKRSITFILQKNLVAFIPISSPLYVNPSYHQSSWAPVSFYISQINGEASSPSGGSDSKFKVRLHRYIHLAHALTWTSKEPILCSTYSKRFIFVHILSQIWHILLDPSVTHWHNNACWLSQRSCQAKWMLWHQ